jgi:hypothetical protein
VCLISWAVAGVLAACGGSSSVTGPDAATPAAAATITGTVVTTGASAAPSGDVAARSGAEGIRVSVSGTPLQTTTDDEGHFTLDDVAPGERVELHFQGPGIDARLEIGGLTAGQRLAVTVRVSGSTASMLTPSDEVELRGSVEMVGLDRVRVDGRTVQVVAGTTELLGRQNQPIGLADIAVGTFVQIEGWTQPDGSLLGKKIKLEDGPGDDPNDPMEVEFLGNIQSLSPLTIADTRISTDVNTRILDDDNNPIGLSALAVGMRVEVEGWPQADGSVLAQKIKIED